MARVGQERARRGIVEEAEHAGAEEAVHDEVALVLGIEATGVVDDPGDSGLAGALSRRRRRGARARRDGLEALLGTLLQLAPP
jgi:hypothetical protein